MAKFVSDKSAERWNRTADIVSGGGAGNRFVRGLYREPKGGSASCTELGLDPGTYRATAGATIAPGATGAIQVSGGVDCAAVVVDAVNHSECTFYLGDRVTAHVDKCCSAWFTSCSCCSTDCCDRSVQVCVNNERVTIAVSGGTHTWDVSDVCDCEGATLEVSIACETVSETSTITATWTLECGEDSDTGTFDLSTLCDAEETLIESFIASDICFLLINFSNSLVECNTAPQTTNDCWCPNGTIGCTFNGVLFDITGLVANPPRDCDCVNINGKYLLRYPDDVTVENCGAVELARTIPLTCSTGGLDGLRLAWTMQCVANNIRVSLFVAIIQGGLFRPTIVNQTNTEAIATFNCFGYSITTAGPGSVGVLDECDATGASVTGTVV